MNLFSRLFKKSTETQVPNIQFGRFTDTYKSEEKYESWDKSIELFENEKYLNSYTHLLDFLITENKENVSYSHVQGQLNFTIYQGSKLIMGHADHKKFSAEAKIAKMKKKHLGLLRLLLEENFDLKYSRYSLDENDCICLRFDTFVEDGSPHKLYQALKEISTISDRRDDVLLEKFDDLESINYSHTRQISQQEKQVKFDFFRKTLTAVIHEFEHGKLNTFMYPGGLSFLMLDGLYAIDYLIKPEGNVMEMIHDSHDMYFADNITLVHDKNKALVKTYRLLEKIGFEDFCKELYEVNSTFGLSVPDGHQRLAEIIDAQINDFDWYYQNKHYHYARAICGYVIGFSLYSYSLPGPSKDLLILYYRIIYNDYFKNLGFSDVFQVNHTLQKKNIISQIKSIIQNHQDKYPGIRADVKYLDFTDEYLFCKSYLTMLKNLNYPE
jgi:hypothetical protein